MENVKICVIFVVFGREVNILEFINVIFDKDDIVKVDREDDFEKIVDDIIMKVSEFVFVFYYKYGVVLIYKIFVFVFFSIFFKLFE